MLLCSVLFDEVCVGGCVLACKRHVSRPAGGFSDGSGRGTSE